MVTSSLLHDHMHCQLHFSFLSEVHLTSEVLPGQGGATVCLLRALSLDQSMPDVRVTDGLILADGMVGVLVSGQVCFEGGQSPCGCARPLSSFLTTISYLPCTRENISYDTQQSSSCAVPNRWFCCCWEFSGSTPDTRLAQETLRVPWVAVSLCCGHLHVTSSKIVWCALAVSASGCDAAFDVDIQGNCNACGALGQICCMDAPQCSGTLACDTNSVCDDPSGASPLQTPRCMKHGKCAQMTMHGCDVPTLVCRFYLHVQ